MAVTSKKNIKEIEQNKFEKTMETVAWRAGYYRNNPQRFVKDVLQINLKLFQKILIHAMMNNYYFMFIACRGLGKSWLTALFCCVRCILYPGTKIVVVAGTLKQANETLLKIEKDLMRQSSILRTEIEICNIGQNESIIQFRNGSWISAAVSNDNSRGLRANIIVCDEFRMVDKTVLDKVIRKFLTSPRQPGYLRKAEYSDLQERNHEIYMSSAWFKSHWAWEKFQSYVVNFFDDTKKYFTCALPYQLSIKEGLLMRDQVLDEMSESDFDEMAWKMEMECEFFGDDEGSFFNFEELNKRRRIKTSLLPLEFYNDKFKVPHVNVGCRRVLSVDVALMISTKKKKNDAAALYINDLTLADPTSYHSNFTYGKTFEGLTTDELGLNVMRMYYHYHCTDIVLDCAGIGLGVYDFIIKDQYDPETGETYKALNCCNNDEMAVRCKVEGAEKVIWSIKATPQFNSDICVGLRSGIQNGKINFLISENEADEVLSNIYKPYFKMSPSNQGRMKEGYAQITMAIYELVKLKYSVNDGKIKVYEVSGMRKDRYSSLAYSYWCAGQLEQRLRPKTKSMESLVKKLIMRKGYL